MLSNRSLVACAYEDIPTRSEITPLLKRSRTVSLTDAAAKSALHSSSGPVFLGFRLLRQLRAVCRLMDLRPALLLVLLSLMEAVVVAKVGQVAGGFYLILVNKQLQQFWSTVLKSALLYCVSALLAATTDGVANHLAVRWRGSVTQKLQRSYCAASHPFYSLPAHVDNPDQRIAQDAALLCKLVSDIAKVLLSVPLRVVYYTYWTYHYTSIRPLLAVLLFFVVGAVLQRLVMQPLSVLTFQQDQREGEFRSAHSRMRQLKEEIALRRGGHVELQSLNGKLDALLSIQFSVVWQRWLVGLSTKGIEYVGVLVNYAAIAVPVFSGAWDHLDSGHLAEAVSVSSFMTLSLVYSLTQVLDLADTWATTAGAAGRVCELIEAMDVKHNDLTAQNSPKAEQQSTTLDSSWEGYPSTEMRSPSLSTLLMGPASLNDPANGIQLEYSIHALGPGLCADVVHIFPEAPRSSPLLAVMTFQRARNNLDLTISGAEAISQQVIDEMDRLLCCFLQWQGVVRHALNDMGYWCDAVDPRTGRALHGNGIERWSEVTAASVLLGYKKSDAGVCPVVLHPTFGCSSYPVTLFTSAPVTVLQNVIAASHTPEVGPSFMPPCQTVVFLQGITCYTPSGSLVVRQLNLELGAGSSCMVSGPSGCGKSTLVKALAGLWQVEATRVQLPATDQLAIVPQQPFVGPGCTLRHLLMYPHSMQPDNAVTHQTPTDLQVRQLLEATSLAYLAERVSHDFDEPYDWQGALTPGEMQRLTIAGLLFQQPIVAVLDEATSAMNEQLECSMYHLMRAAGISVLTFGQRQCLLDLHDNAISLAADGSGAWEVAAGKLEQG